MLLIKQTISIKLKFKKFKTNDFVDKIGLKPIDVCINYALSQNFDKIIIGVNNHKQLKEIIKIKNKKINIPKSLSSKNKFLVNPYNWS